MIPLSLDLMRHLGPALDGGAGLPGKSSRNSRNLSPDGAKVQAG